MSKCFMCDPGKPSKVHIVSVLDHSTGKIGLLSLPGCAVKTIKSLTPKPVAPIEPTSKQPNFDAAVGFKPLSELNADEKAAMWDILKGYGV